MTTRSRAVRSPQSAAAREARTWTHRLVEIATFQIADQRWSDVWALLIKAQRLRTDEWLAEILWIWKLSAWLCAIAEDSETCVTCGGRISDPEPRRRYCSEAHKLIAWRRRSANRSTDFEEVVARAHTDMRRVAQEIESAHRSLHRWQKAKTAIAPPNLLRISNLPKVPPRCGTGCSAEVVSCAHTGGYCLFAGTTETDTRSPKDETHERQDHPPRTTVATAQPRHRTRSQDR